MILADAPWFFDHPDQHLDGSPITAACDVVRMGAQQAMRLGRSPGFGYCGTCAKYVWKRRR